MAHASGNPTWADYPAVTTLVTAATLEAQETTADRLTTAVFGGLTRTVAPVCEFHLITQQGPFTGDAVLQAGFSSDIDNASALHLGSLTANDYTTYTIPVSGRYTLMFRVVYGNSTGANETHILWQGTAVGTNTISQSSYGPSIVQTATEDAVFTTGDVLRFAAYSTVSNTVNVSRLGHVTTKGVVRYVGPT